MAQDDWNPFRSDKAKTASGTLLFWRDGDGRPLIYLHSAGGPRPSPLIRALSRSRDVYAPTVPGFGGSPRHEGIDDIAALAELIAGFIAGRFSEPVDIVGNSFGGWLAMRIALAHPDLVDHLVLEAPAGVYDRDLDVVPRIFAREETAPPPSPHRAGDVAAFASYGGGRIDPELADRLGEITAQTLVVIGTEDEMAPATAMQRVKAALPNCHLTYIYEAGHGLEHDAPERVGRVVSDFLERGQAFLVPTARDQR